MFNFLSMVGNYKERLVANYNQNGVEVDTVLVTDSSKPYETGVRCSQYNSGRWVIVELYDTKEQAQAGHDKWVKKMTAKKLPQQLKDVSTCAIASIAKNLDSNFGKYKKEEVNRVE